MGRRKYIIIFLGILLIGFVTITFWNQPQNQPNETKNKPTNEEKEHRDDSSDMNKKDNTQEKADNQPAENSVTQQFGEIIDDAVQRTIDFFTNTETKVVAIGDSLTKGVGDKVVDGGYVGILDKTINKRNELVMFENYGVRGNTSSQLLARLDNPEIVHSIKEADIILITIGANDIMQVVKENFANLDLKDFKQERAAYKKRLKSILDKMKALNSKADIYLLGFYNPFGKYFPDLEELGLIVKNWNKTGKTVSEQYDKVTFIPIADVFDDPNTDLFAADNFHPNHQGYQRMAKQVLKYITK